MSADTVTTPGISKAVIYRVAAKAIAGTVVAILAVIGFKSLTGTQVQFVDTHSTAGEYQPQYWRSPSPAASVVKPGKG